MKTNNNKTDLNNENGALIQSCVSVSVPEFRYDNLIDHVSFGIVKVKAIAIDGLNILYKNNFYWDDMKYYKSIPITEELLLKIGAIKLDFKDFPSFNLLGTQINFINGIWIDYATRVEIKGLHHLQNIFFFRNSEELQISSLTEH